MWVKTTSCNSSLSSFNKKLLFTIFLYWSSLIPVRRLLRAEGYKLLSFSSFSWKGATTPLALVLADVLVHRCQPIEGYNLLSFSSFSWKVATTRLALVLADVLVHRCWPIEGYNLLFLHPSTTFHKFSDWILTTSYSEGHVSSNFHTGPINIIEAQNQSPLASSISESPKTESLKPYQQNAVTRTQRKTQNSATMFRSNCIIKNHAS